MDRISKLSEKRIAIQMRRYNSIIATKGLTLVAQALLRDIELLKKKR